MAGTVTTDVLEIRAAEPFGEGKRVDRAAGIVRGVKVLGSRTVNKQRGLPTRYAEGALDKAVSLYEGATVYLDHPADRNPDAERPYRDRFGRLEGARRQPDGIYADLRVNPEHPQARQFLWDAEHNSAGMGLSHNARLTGAVHGGEFVYESINRVRSVDVVTEPATTQGLFESRNPTEETMSGTAPTTTPAPAGAAPSSGAQAPGATPPAAPTQPAAAPVAATESRAPSAPAQPAAPGDAIEQRFAQLESRFTERLSKLEQENRELKAASETQARREKFDALILESRLPSWAVENVREHVYACKDEAGAKALLESVRKVAWHQTPGAPPAAAAAAGKPIETAADAVEFLRNGR